jgi:hypothetical protein
MPTLYQLEAYQKDALVVSPSGEVFSEAGIVYSPALNVIAKDQQTQALLNYYEQQNQANLKQALADQGVDITKPTSSTGTVATIVPKQVTATNPVVKPGAIAGTGVNIVTGESGSSLNLKLVLIGGLGIFLMLFIFKR